MAVEWIPPRRPEGLRALLSPAPAPAHDVGKFSLHSSILPVAPATARQRDKLPAPSKPHVHARMSAIRSLTQVRSGRQAGRQASRQAGRQAGNKTSRPAHRSASNGAPREPPIKECWSQDNLLGPVPGTTRGASQCRQDIASTDDDDGTTDHMTGRPLTRRDVWTSRHQRRVSRRCWPTTETGLTDTRMQVDGRRQHAHAHVM